METAFHLNLPLTIAITFMTAKPRMTLQKLAPLLLGWLNPATEAAILALCWGIFLVFCLWLVYTTVMAVNMFVVSDHQPSNMRLAKLLILTSFVAMAPIGVFVRRYYKGRKESAILKNDPKNGGLCFSSGGDSYPATLCENGDYRLQVGDGDRFAIVSEFVEGYRMTTDEGKEFYLPRRFSVVDYLPLFFVASFVLWIDIHFCMQQGTSSSALNLPTEYTQGVWVLVAIFGYKFVKGAMFVIKTQQYPTRRILAVSGAILGGVLGWFLFRDLADSIIAAIAVAGLYVVAGMLLDRQRRPHLIKPSAAPDI